MATSLNNLYVAQSSHDEAEPLLVQALEMYQCTHNNTDHQYIAITLDNLADLYDGVR